MTDRTFRGITLALLASTALATPALAQNTQPQTTVRPTAPGTNATDVTTPPPPVQQRQAAAGVPDQSEIIITATKREENLQNVPISVQVLGTRKLDQLNISNFEQYTKQLPSVSYNFSQAGGTVVYMRGIATGGDGNHSGALPSVGVYLDEQPVTTIGGSLDVHIYDIARIESLAGPQGTLFGASSEAGTIRIITNKPEIGVLTGRVDTELNAVDHGDIGGKAEGMVNFPLGPHMALRLVGFYEHDAGYIDNVFGSRTYRAPSISEGFAPQDISFDNKQFVKNNFNGVDVYGGRAALKIDLDDNWTVLPQLMYQNKIEHGVFFEDADQAPLQTVRFQNEFARDHFTQAALTIEGKIANFDLTYAGAYMDRPRHTSNDYTDYTDAYDAYYQYLGYTGILDALNYRDNSGNLINPRQHIDGTEHFTKLSQELRIATPVNQPIRALVGAFYQRQTNDILQDYLVDNLATSLSVPGWANTIWLTKQYRVDRDYALFGEANWDVTPQITLTAGGRYYKFDNTLIGFNGFGPNNPDYSTLGYNRCLTVNGLQLRDDPGSALISGGVSGTPCTNVGQVVNGKLEPKRSKDTGFIHRLNAQWKPARGLMFYATWSRGFRPGGINRQPTAPAYGADFLTNYEAGWKTTFAGNRVRWNGAIYHQIWNKLQFSFLGANSLTVIQNGRQAKINGVESDLNYISGGLSLTLTGAYTDAKTSGAICHSSVDPTADCTAAGDWIITPSGTRLPITPKFKGSATARYQWPLGAGKAHVQGVVSYQGSASADIRQNIDGSGTNPNDFLGRIHSSTVVDLFTGWDWHNYSIELFASNVFDERNELSRFVPCSICTQTKIVIGRPRTIGLRLGAKF
jgi:outer membrane receptor protein involved in Fe transport